MALATIATTTTAAAALSSSSSAFFKSNPPHQTGSLTASPPKPTECSLLGPFAIVVQLALGALALLSLVYKRWRERPQRPVKIWFFDVSKQVFGSVLVHGANVFMSLLTSGKFSIEVDAGAVAAGRVVRRAVMQGLFGQESGVLGVRGEGGEEYVPNPCSFYLLNLGIDTTLGIPILILILRVLTRLVALTPLGSPPESIQSGNYGNPPNAWWWLKQSLIYFCGLMGMKLVVLVLFMMLPWLPRIGDWALGWTEGNEKLQIVFVMMLFPLIMNALQYYIIDSYIKKQDALTADGNGGAGADGPVVYEELAVSESDEDSDDEDEDDVRKSLDSNSGDSHVPLQRRGSSTRRSSRDAEYDPAVDGDSQTVIGSSSSHTSNKEALPKELLPAE
ncbi:vacuolar membrane protein-domain-containing protein [Corynascus novoguineensis]|uniref:Vacuolar membrane protein-domain-containing protein n=1 Tax=Corynascus novoguineensis TaxID=1126955 RepID=A0AAN7D1N9_9PEZI|nr:vacuolar membrane protein-domain-containing protein [Corynascus novoguineensis]